MLIVFLRRWEDNTVADYRKFIRDLSRKVPTDIADLSRSRERGRRPTQAFSDFAIHREQGDWAEKVVTEGLRKALGGSCKVVKYGRTDDIMAGEPGFESFYTKYQDELDAVGKKPDVLVFRAGDYPSDAGLDISTLPPKAQSTIASKAFAGLEVRSSAFMKSKYRGNDEEKFLSFTPKVEDIMVVLKWIETFCVPHFYVQVLFDSAYLISFQRILEVISDPTNEDTKYKIVRHRRNQEKSTIHIRLDEGTYLGKVTEPNHESAKRELPGGRLIYYVKFSGGKVDIAEKALNSLRDAGDRFRTHSR